MSTSSDLTSAVLVVEDDERLRLKLAEIVVQIWRLRALVATDFATGLALARAYRPEYGVIDLWLPGGTGIGLISAMRDDNKAARLVLITGCGTTDLTVEAMRAGANYVVDKPFTESQLAGPLFGEVVSQELGERPRPHSVELMTWEHIQRVYRESGGNLSLTAKLVGLDRKTVKIWLEKLRPNR